MSRHTRRARIVAALAALIAGPALGYPDAWFGLRTPPRPAADPAWHLIVRGAIQEQSPESTRLNLTMGRGRILITGPLLHHGRTVCGPASRCRITAPNTSPAWAIYPDARLILSADTAPATGPQITLYASHPALPGAGPGRVEVEGVLALPPGAAIDVLGTPPYLPMPLLIARGLPVAPAAGTLPAGTALELRPAPGLIMLYLVEAP